MRQRVCVKSVSSCIDPLDAFQHVRLIAKQLHRALPAHVDLDELVAEGLLGLVQAAQRFDPKRKLKFRTYAEHRIRGAMMDSLRRIDPVSREVRRRLREAEKVIDGLRQKLMREPETEEIAQALRMPLADWHDLCAQGERAAVLTAREGQDGEGYRPREPISSGGDSPEEAAFRAEMGRIMRECLRFVPARERRILILRYMHEQTLEEIGRLVGLHPSRISQMHAAALAMLRTRVKAILNERL